MNCRKQDQGCSKPCKTPKVYCSSANLRSFCCARLHSPHFCFHVSCIIELCKAAVPLPSDKARDARTSERFDVDRIGRSQSGGCRRRQRFLSERGLVHFPVASARRASLSRNSYLHTNCLCMQYVDKGERILVNAGSGRTGDFYRASRWEVGWAPPPGAGQRSGERVYCVYAYMRTEQRRNV